MLWDPPIPDVSTPRFNSAYTTESADWLRPPEPPVLEEHIRTRLRTMVRPGRTRAQRWFVTFCVMAVLGAITALLIAVITGSVLVAAAGGATLVFIWPLAYETLTVMKHREPQ